MNYPLCTCGDNVNYYENVHHPFPTPEKWGTSWKFSKEISKLCFQSSVQVYSLLGQTEGYKKGNHIVRLPPRALGCHKI